MDRKRKYGNKTTVQSDIRYFASSFIINLEVFDKYVRSYNNSNNNNNNNNKDKSSLKDDKLSLRPIVLHTGCFTILACTMHSMLKRVPSSSSVCLLVTKAAILTPFYENYSHRALYHHGRYYYYAYPL